MQDMKLMTQCGVGIILLVGLCAVAQAAPEQQGTREGTRAEWLSWTPAQRNAYVYGLVDGYLMGFYRACDLADQLFETDKPHRIGDEQHPTDLPSGRCLAHRGEFSRAKFDKEGHFDVSAYTDVITAFYEHHTSCRDFPFSILLQVLSSKYATGDELYELALKGGLEGYPRSRQWCTSGDSQAPKP